MTSTDTEDFMMTEFEPIEEVNAGRFSDTESGTAADERAEVTTDTAFIQPDVNGSAYSEGFDDDENTVLKLSKINKRFGSNHVLIDVDFAMKKGEVVAVIGQSGGGKSTLLRCIAFLERIEKGEITIDHDKIVTEVNGKSVYPKDEELRRRALKVGLVFQDFNLFPHLSVLTNLTLAPSLVQKLSKQQAVEKAKKLLEKVGLTDKINAFPYELSGGQKQRVAIARALAMEPDLLCFDEPTSALDPELTGEVLKVIKDLKLKMHSTMLIVTHEMGFARSVADRVVFIDGGVILESGTPEEVFTNPKNERTRSFLSKMNEEA